MIESRCGLKCSKCDWKPKTNCPGCIEAHGKPFHGTCPVACCCENKNLLHCGKCEKFSCQQLTDYAYDKEHGDNGERLETLKKWLLEEV